ncbi:MAG: radical SAM protein, partial [Dehalococcoidia bacterium]|nr:radical SAM protein [Dehalococcoidia bacterium]
MTRGPGDSFPGRKKCQRCGAGSFPISSALGLCAQCISTGHPEVRTRLEEVHLRARQEAGLPGQPPAGSNGVRCRLCVNECRIPPGGRGYCGLRTNTDRRLTGATADRGNVRWYHDPLPTNCVASWTCPGGTGAGYPKFARSNGPEYGYKNLAVFYCACSFDCLFCQNWQHRRLAILEPDVSAAELASAVDEDTTCICYFGGDPAPQLPHAIRTSRLALEKRRPGVLRICWETNGSMHPALLQQAVELSLSSGGCIKFDLKAWDENIHFALCGQSNRRTLDNFRLAAQHARRRTWPPLLVASTLLVPGYVEAGEVAKIAAFIASIDPEIPYTLLAFHPQFVMDDLPPTSRRHAAECLAAARAQG